MNLVIGTLHCIPSLMLMLYIRDQEGQLVVDYLYNNGEPDRLLAAIGKALLREDRNFHSIQMIEAAFRQYYLIFAGDGENNNNSYSTTGAHLLLAAARY